MELRKFFRNRAGAFFSTDALIALVVILFVILAVRPLSDYVQPDADIHSDILLALSSLKVGELEDSTVQGMIASGVIRDPTKSLLEQIGEFYVYNLTNARILASIALQDIHTTENIGIWYEDDLIFSSNSTPFESAEDVDVVRRVISGIQAGQNITGFSARASLSSDYHTNYFYFGGYVGDGNVSVLVDYLGNITDEAEMELVINTSTGSFEFFVNGAPQGNLATSPSPYEPVVYTFNTSDFAPGQNLLEFKGGDLYIAGGYLKISYRGDVQFGSRNHTYYFPGIDGLVNLYDGFFVPDDLTEMEVLLHLESNYTILLNIGNVSVYNGSTVGEEGILLDNSFLSSLLDYSVMEGKTIPLRLGLENATYTGIVQTIDVFSVTDLSGSMDDNCGGCSEWTCTPAASCHDANGCKICDAKEANYLLVDYILNTTGNRVGLVGYESTARDSDYHELSNDTSSLVSEASGWDADGNTCICCGINKAVQGFVSELQSAKQGGLITYYDFDQEIVGGVVNDLSGEGNNGTLVGSASNVSGLEQSALSFSSSGINYISMPDLITSSEGTISFWIDPDMDNSETIFDASTSSKYFFVDIDASENLRFSFEDVSDADFDDANYNVHDIHLSGWHHVAVVWRYNGGYPSAELYFDGSLVDYDGNTAGTIADFLTPWIGQTRSNYQTTWDYEGDIDEFRIYNRALEDSEILGLFDQTPTCDNGIVEVGEVCDGNEWCDFGGANGTKECNGFCSGFLACSEGVCGDGVKNDGEECDDGNLDNNDTCSGSCELPDKFRSMVVMSDGQANVQCGEQGTGNPFNDAILASQQACDNYGITVHAVGFGTGVDETTLTSIANNGCGGQYFYSSTANLTEVYRQIAEVILTEYVEQTLSASGTGINTKLYPDSYIKFNYTEPDYSYGLVITAEADFDDENGGSFFVPNGSDPLITSVVSYSGPKWTSGVSINNHSIFSLDDYGGKYTFLGDPYQVTMLNSVLSGEMNYANVSTGVSVTNKSAGSEFNKIIYTIGKNASAYSSVVALAEGCVWSVQMEDGSFVNGLQIPSSYTGSDECYYNETALYLGEYGIIENDDDSYQLAVLNLLRELDLDTDGRSDVFFTERDLAINLDEFSGIPFAYSTEVEIRRWV
ncbi:MAG: LamG-like jellyroll fold domain-containing protein [archaeon]